MRYRTTRAADKDFIEIFVRGAAEFGIGQAERYAAGLIDAFELLASSPRMARLRTELQPPMRLHPYRAHLIAYVEHEDGVLIVRVVHGRQDWQWLLTES